jgi:hypothetical protein
VLKLVKEVQSLTRAENIFSLHTQDMTYCIRSTDTPSSGVEVTPDRFGATADGSSLYPTEGDCLRVYPSSALSMLKIVIFFCFFYRSFFTSKNTRKISRKINITYRKISYNRNPVM